MTIMGMLTIQTLNSQTISCVRRIVPFDPISTTTTVIQHKSTL
jgi:hypothetical protein